MESNNLKAVIKPKPTAQSLMLNAVFGKLKKQGIKKILLDFSNDDFDLVPLDADDIIVKKSRLIDLEDCEKKLTYILKQQNK